MSRRIRGIIIELEASSTGLEKALKDIDSKTKEVNKELRDLNGLLKFSPDSTVLLEQKQKLLGEQIKNTSDKLKNLREAEAEVQRQFEAGEIGEKQYRDFQKTVVETESKLKHYEDQLRSLTNTNVLLGQKMQEVGKDMQAAGEKMTSVGKKLTLGVTTPIAAIGTVSFKAAAEFETGMAGVRKTTDMTASELDLMGQALRKMALEIPASTTELTSIAEAAGQLGIKKENIVDFTRVIADLGVATNIAGDEGATALAQFANITKMAQTDFDRMGSSIVELGNNTATTERDILNMSTRLAAAGVQANMSEADILGIAAGLASLGLEAQAGGSAFSKVINQIQLEVDTGGDKLEDFANIAGMSASAFSKAWKEDAASALSAFIVGLGDTERQGKSTNEMLNELGITELRMGDALRRTAGANELFTETLEMSNRAWEENNALTNEASILYETTESKMQIAKNQLNDAAIELGTKLLPVVSDVVGMFSEWVGKFTELPDATQNTIIKLGLLAAAMGPVLTVGGKLVEGVGKLTTGLGSMIEKIGSGAGALTGLTTGGTVGLAIAGVGALVSIIAILASTYESTTTQVYDLIKATEKSAEAHEKVKHEIKTNSAELKQLGDRYFELSDKTRLSNAEQEEMKWLSEDIVALMPELNGYLEEETGLLKMGKDAWEKYFDAKDQYETEKANYERRKELAVEYDELLQKLAVAQRERSDAEAKYGDSTAIEAARRLSQTKDNVDKLTGALDLNREAWVEAGGQTEDGARRAEWAAGMIEYAYGKVGKAASDTADDVEDAEDRKTTATETGLEARTRAAREMFAAYEEEQDKVAEHLKKIENLTADNVQSMSGFSKERIDLSNTTTRQFMDNLIAEREAFNNYHANLTEIASRVGPDVAEELEKIGPQAAPLIQQFVDGSDEQLAELKEIFRSRTKDAANAAKKEMEKMDGAPHGRNWIQGLINGMEDKRAALKLAAQSLASEVGRATSRQLQERSPSRLAMKSGRNWGEGLILGLEEMRKKVANSAASLAESVTGTMYQPNVIPITAALRSAAVYAPATGSIAAGSGRAAAAGGVTQHITINSPDPLTPSEVARQTKNASQQLAMEW